MTTNTYDVIIIGCGPVGALCSLLLGSYGLSVLILEKDGKHVFPAPRAVALDDEIIRILGLHSISLSKWLDNNILKCPVDIRNGPCGGSGHSILGPQPMHIVESTGGYADTAFFFQPDMETLLRQCIEKHENITVKWNTEVTLLF